MKLISGIDAGPVIEFSFDGRALAAHAGESIASALMRAGIACQRRGWRRDEPRGYYCGMGLCWECAVDVEGVGVVRGCGYPATPGLQVRTADGDLE
ncbi:(2Fe-2S)-binding protein [Burkholderia multivorans]|nr:(2Fe-2S)-binding protein [Burkholderia multivorans]MCA8143518.1 (2Fe-2S)-binding protein [Burkholderia multivorans]MCO1368528.1 (2Fe-2S)-binding protein [Burkholderia multivorans]UQP21470.1 (2Fe-2S)-binding protein [Burkholderia multivorans]UQP92083.1 (2Fe-2S)-binding protein [Burkholderia multivorans]